MGSEGDGRIGCSKRGREEEEEEDEEQSSEDIIIMKEVGESSKKSKRTALRWNWMDEYTLLNNLYEFAGKNGSCSKEFFHFVKGKLSVEVSNSQLSDKVYKLKKRFLKDKGKMEEQGISYFSNGEHEKLFQMSNHIWGDQQSQYWKAEAADGYLGELFKRLLIENFGLDIASISPDVLLDIRHDWEDMKTAENEYNLMDAKLLSQLSDIRCAQNI